MAEQHRFQHGFGERRAIDRDERAVGARALGMDGAGQHFLAGAGRAVDQHGDVGGGDAAGQRVEREALGIGRHRLVPAAQQGGGKGMGQFGVGVGIGQAGGAAALERRRGRRTVGQHQRPGGDRRHFAFHDQEHVARTRLLPGIGECEPLRAQRRDQREPGREHGGGRIDRAHRFGNPPVRHLFAGKWLTAGKMNPDSALYSAYALVRARRAAEIRNFFP